MGINGISEINKVKSKQDTTSVLIVALHSEIELTKGFLNCKALCASEKTFMHIYSFELQAYVEVNRNQLCKYGVKLIENL